MNAEDDAVFEALDDVSDEIKHWVSCCKCGLGYGSWEAFWMSTSTDEGMQELRRRRRLRGLPEIEDILEEFDV